MTDVVCAGCGSTQREGAPFCAACGREFPRTGRPVVEPAPQPRGQVQQTAAAARGGSGSVPLVQSRPPITTEVEVYTATQIPSSGSLPPQMAAPYAGVGKRFVAWLVDGVIAGVLAGIVIGIGIALIDMPSGLIVVSEEQAAEIGAQMVRAYLLGALVAFCYQLSMWIWEARTGATLGNKVMGVRTVSAEDRGPIGFVRELLRVLVLAAGSFVLGVGQIVVLLSPLWDKGGKVQGWHDKAARSVVVDVRAPQVAMATGLAPVAPGPRAPGKPAMRTAASAPTPYTPAQQPPQAAAPQSPARPPVTAPDPWAFPQAPVAPPTGEGLITGIPGSAPSAPAQPAPAQPAPVQPAPAPVQQPQPQQPTQPEVPQQEHPESRPTRPVTLQQDGATAAPAQQEEPAWDATRMQAPVLEPAATVSVTIELESGARHTIDGSALVGRNPQAAEGSGVLLVRVEDPTRSVSKNHAELGVDSAGLWLTDRGSTNGTVVSAPGRSPQVAEPGARVRVPVGATIHVGDRRIVVHAAEPRA